MKKGKSGCNQGEDCGYFHPKMCRFETKCHNSNCKRLHPKNRRLNKEGSKDIPKESPKNRTKQTPIEIQEQIPSREDFQKGDKLKDSSQLDLIMKRLEEMQQSILSGKQFMEKMNYNVSFLMGERNSQTKSQNMRSCCPGH